MDREKFTLTLYFAFEWQKSGNFRRKSDFHSYFHFSVLFVFYFCFHLEVTCARASYKETDTILIG